MNPYPERLLMLVLVNTDRHVEGGDDLSRWVETELTNSLERFADQMTRVEVHLGDDNSHKGGSNDKRCQLEARVAGLQPISVTELSSTIDEAVTGAIEKLVTTLDRTLGRLGRQKGQTSFGGDQTI